LAVYLTKGLSLFLSRKLCRGNKVDWGFFLFWNEFQIEKPPEAETKKTSGRKTVTPKSSHRKRKGISPPRDPTKSSSGKKKGIKRKL
jgi:hypothetical protein